MFKSLLLVGLSASIGAAFASSRESEDDSQGGGTTIIYNGRQLPGFERDNFTPVMEATKAAVQKLMDTPNPSVGPAQRSNSLLFQALLSAGGPEAIKAITGGGTVLGTAMLELARTDTPLKTEDDGTVVFSSFAIKDELLMLAEAVLVGSFGLVPYLEQGATTDPAFESDQAPSVSEFLASVKGTVAGGGSAMTALDLVDMGAPFAPMMAVNGSGFRYTKAYGAIIAAAAQLLKLSPEAILMGSADVNSITRDYMVNSIWTRDASAMFLNEKLTAANMPSVDVTGFTL